MWRTSHRPSLSSFAMACALSAAACFGMAAMAQTPPQTPPKPAPLNAPRPAPKPAPQVVPPLAPQTAAVAAAPRLVLLTSRFRSPLNSATLMQRLAAYYDEQVGRNLALAMPEVAPNRRFEIWHDMWIEFEPLAEGTGITLKRPTAADSTRIAKGWMLEFAGRLEAPLPLEFQETVPLHMVEGEFWGARHDAELALAATTPMQSLPSWEHAGVLVSSSPLVLIAIAPAGQHGVHHVTVTAESAALARQIWSTLQRTSSRPGLYAAWSEQAELEAELKANARSQNDTLAVTSSSAVYIPQIDPGRTEQKLREDPEMRNRMVAAQGQYSVKYRLDPRYPKSSLVWLELTSYNKADGKFAAERLLGEANLPAPKPAAATAGPLTVRIKLPALSPGAYRVKLQGDGGSGSAVRIDERTYWFDGKVFEEM